MQLKRLIIQYRCLFEPQKTKTVRGFEATVEVEPGSKPAVGRTYRQTHANDALIFVVLFVLFVSFVPSIPFAACTTSRLFCVS